MVFGFDKPFAHPKGSFNQAVNPPTSDPDEGDLISVCFAREWMPYVLGALSQLNLQTTWTGTPEEILLAQERAALLMSMLGEEVCSLATAPFWDDPEGDDAPGNPDEGEGAPWYFLWDGASTFTENVENWVIAAFVAIASTPGSAILFLTIAKNFRLAWRTRDYGGIVKIFINATQVATVDTYSAAPGLISANIIIPPETEPPYELVVWADGTHNASAAPDANGNYPVETIRKRLDSSEVIPPGTRWDEECDCVQETPDDGVTWTQNDGLDPRVNPGSQFPPRGGADPRCDAAENAGLKLEQLINAIVIGVSDGQIAMTILDICLLFIPGINILVSLIWVVTELLLAIGTTVIAAAFDSTTYDTIVCIFYCRMDDEGVVTEEALVNILADIEAQIGGVASAVCQIIIGQVWKQVGLTNAGVLGDASGDCDECACEWCIHYDFTVSDWGFVADTYGHWESGRGWVSDTVTGSAQAMIVLLDFTATTIKSYATTQCFDVDAGGTGAGRYTDLRNGPSIVSSSAGGAASGCEPTGHEGTWTATRLLVNPSGTLSSGNIVMTDAYLSGIGEKPSGGEDCE